jgi:hypothetical protein
MLSRIVAYFVAQVAADLLAEAVISSMAKLLAASTNFLAGSGFLVGIVGDSNGGRALGPSRFRRSGLTRVGRRRVRVVPEFRRVVERHEDKPVRDIGDRLDRGHILLWSMGPLFQRFETSFEASDELFLLLDERCKKTIGRGRFVKTNAGPTAARLRRTRRGPVHLSIVRRSGVGRGPGPGLEVGLRGEIVHRDLAISEKFDALRKRGKLFAGVFEAGLGLVVSDTEFKEIDALASRYANFVND